LPYRAMKKRKYRTKGLVWQEKTQPVVGWGGASGNELERGGGRRLRLCLGNSCQGRQNRGGNGFGKREGRGGGNIILELGHKNAKKTMRRGGRGGEKKNKIQT